MSVDLRDLIDRAANAPGSALAFDDEAVLGFLIREKLSESEFCDRFAEETCRLFLSEDLTFELADRAMNALNWYGNMGPFKMELLPDFSWQVYLAFDSGEHDHGGRVANAIESITIPRVRILVSRCRA